MQHKSSEMATSFRAARQCAAVHDLRYGVSLATTSPTGEALRHNPPYESQRQGSGCGSLSTPAAGTAGRASPASQGEGATGHVGVVTVDLRGGLYAKVLTRVLESVVSPIPGVVLEAVRVDRDALRVVLRSNVSTEQVTVLVRESLRAEADRWRADARVGDARIPAVALDAGDSRVGRLLDRWHTSTLWAEHAEALIRRWSSSAAEDLPPGEWEGLVLRSGGEQLPVLANDWAQAPPAPQGPSVSGRAVSTDRPGFPGPAHSPQAIGAGSSGRAAARPEHFLNEGIV